MNIFTIEYSKNHANEKYKDGTADPDGSIDQLVPEDHLLRKIDETIDFSFIYDLVEEKCSPDMGRPSIDPVMPIKIPLIQYLEGIPSMRQTTENIAVNVAYRWFLDLDFFDPVPHFSTFGKTTNVALKAPIYLNRSSQRS